VTSINPDLEIKQGQMVYAAEPDGQTFTATNTATGQTAAGATLHINEAGQLRHTGGTVSGSPAAGTNPQPAVGLAVTNRETGEALPESAINNAVDLPVDVEQQTNQYTLTANRQPDNLYDGEKVNRDGTVTRFKDAELTLDPQTGQWDFKGGRSHTATPAFWEAHKDAVSHGMQSIFDDDYDGDADISEWKYTRAHDKYDRHNGYIPVGEDAANLLFQKHGAKEIDRVHWTHENLVDAIARNEIKWNEEAGEYQITAHGMAAFD